MKSDTTTLMSPAFHTTLHTCQADMPLLIKVEYPFDTSPVRAQTNPQVFTLQSYDSNGYIFESKPLIDSDTWIWENTSLNYH
jgi:hypothetical protein